ncbi:MAG: preprotein translocase subunit SecG [Acidobacteria bacterium]|nr:preprotein translocase subunit SecG [Acidobacteriota bacterium]
MLLFYTVTTLHVFVCIILVLVVLLQTGKGADLAGAFGGGGTQTAFGSRGPASFLSKMTTIAAIIFMLSSMGLSLISTQRASKSVLEGTVEETVVPDTTAAEEEIADENELTPEQIRRKVEELESKSQAQPNSEEPAPAPESESQ